MVDWIVGKRIDHRALILRASIEKQNTSNSEVYQFLQPRSISTTGAAYFILLKTGTLDLIFKKESLHHKENPPRALKSYLHFVLHIRVDFYVLFGLDWSVLKFPKFTPLPFKSTHL